MLDWISRNIKLSLSLFTSEVCDRGRGPPTVLNAVPCDVALPLVRLALPYSSKLQIDSRNLHPSFPGNLGLLHCILPGSVVIDRAPCIIVPIVAAPQSTGHYHQSLSPVHFVSSILSSCHSLSYLQLFPPIPTPTHILRMYSLLSSLHSVFNATYCTT